MSLARIVGVVFAGGAVLASAILLGLGRAAHALTRTIRHHTRSPR